MALSEIEGKTNEYVCESAYQHARQLKDSLGFSHVDFSDPVFLAQHFGITVHRGEHLEHEVIAVIKKRRNSVSITVTADAPLAKYRFLVAESLGRICIQNSERTKRWNSEIMRYEKEETHDVLKVYGTAFAREILMPYESFSRMVEGSSDADISRRLLVPFVSVGNRRRELGLV